MRRRMRARMRACAAQSAASPAVGHSALQAARKSDKCKLRRASFEPGGPPCLHARPARRPPRRPSPGPNHNCGSRAPGAFYTLDLVFNFHVGFIGKFNGQKTLVMDGHAIARYYVTKGTFVVDLITACCWTAQVGRPGPLRSGCRALCLRARTSCTRRWPGTWWLLAELTRPCTGQAGPPLYHTPIGQASRPGPQEMQPPKVARCVGPAAQGLCRGALPALRPGVRRSARKPLSLTKSSVQTLCRPGLSVLTRGVRRMQVVLLVLVWQHDVGLNSPVVTAYQARSPAQGPSRCSARACADAQRSRSIAHHRSADTGAARG